MTEQEKVQMQEQSSVQQEEKWSYEGSPWISNVFDWMVQKHENSETGKPFWSIKLPSNTFIEHGGQRLDVSHYRFTTNVEPALTHGEAGSPKAVRGIHFPLGWEITLQRIENVAKDGHGPIFEETGRVEGVTPKELAEGLAERASEWRLSHRKANEERDLTQETAEKVERQYEPSL